MLEVRSLSKRYRAIPAVENLNFVLRPHEVCGYLGPNGSGKSTTVRMLTGLMEPSEGEILYRGQSIRNNLVDYKARIGYVPEEPFLYAYLTGWEYLEMVGQLRSLPESRLYEKIDRFLRLFSLGQDRFAPMSSYSKGMRQKVLISAALLHDPEIVILDEPLSGLDVHSAQITKHLISSLADSGKIVLFSSHVLEVVEKICSRVIILHKGRAVADDSVSRLRALTEAPNLEETFSQLAVEEDAREVAEGLMETVRL